MKAENIILSAAHRLSNEEHEERVSRLEEEKANELAKVIREGIFKYKNAYIDAMYIVGNVTIKKMQCSNSEVQLEQVFDKHESLFSILALANTDNLKNRGKYSDSGSVTGKQTIEGVLSGDTKVSEEVLRTIKSDAVGMACEEVLRILREIETTMPF